MGFEKIMVIDDDLDTLHLFDLVLKREGFQVVTATSGQQAFQMIQRDKPNLVLMDLILPKVSGLELVRRLRSNPETQDILIIMFSARGNEDDMMRAFEAGADDYLIKPIPARELIARLKAVLQQSGSRQYRLSLEPDLPHVRDETGQRIGVLAAKGGVGVSTVATNLGIALFQRSSETVIVADFRPGNSTIAAEVDVPGHNGLEKLLSIAPDQITLQRIENQLFHHESGIRFLLASAQPVDAQYSFSAQQLIKISELLPQLSKHNVLDLGSSLTPWVEKIAASSHKIVVVVEPTPHNVLGTRLLLENLHQKFPEAPSLHVVLAHRSEQASSISVEQVQEGINQKVSTVISYAADLIFCSQTQRKPLILCDPDSIPASQFRSLADQLIENKG